MTSKIVSVVLTDRGWNGLVPLTQTCCKSIIPFIGSHRLIDFSLTNLIQAGIKRNLILSRFHCSFLMDHLKHAWGDYKSRIEVLEPIYSQAKQLPVLRQNWTDVLLQHLDAFNRPTDEHVLLVGGEQIHRHYITSLLQYHQIQRAELTLVVAQVPVEQASQYHVVELDEQRQVISIQHQPETPTEIPNKPGFAMVLTENYLFQRPVLVKGLFNNAKKLDGKHDLTKDIVSLLARRVKTALFDLGEIDEKQAPTYWHNVNNLDDYWRLQMMMLVEQSVAGKSGTDALLSKRVESKRPIEYCNIEAIKVRIKDSYIASGCQIEGACAIRSVIGEECELGRNSIVHESILMGRCKIGANSRITRTIIEEDVQIAPGTVIGEKPKRDKARFEMTDGGLIVIPKGSRVGFEEEATPLHENYPEGITDNVM
ncbi:glucose-1-phosphate adenylyltransferase [Vibrio campbellii]|uniref:sugar phosphate nucleotidyltransferase n=1 Tax=Vibrio campbellii TaxID=680 RepID=UPI001D171117|nr:sugar phosphate nucleotidyltransferase [Vibrio campbellii]MCC4224190.1 glucose-1-phosphate adenylyltransferase [Vibrio campbellii]